MYGISSWSFFFFFPLVHAEEGDESPLIVIVCHENLDHARARQNRSRNFKIKNCSLVIDCKLQLQKVSFTTTTTTTTTEQNDYHLRLTGISKSIDMSLLVLRAVEELPKQP